MLKTSMGIVNIGELKIQQIGWSADWDDTTDLDGNKFTSAVVQIFE